MLTVTRSHEICAGHRIADHEGHCARLHGHNYVFQFICEGDLDPLGRVIDFAVIKGKLCQWLEDNWDHKTLLHVHDPWIRSLLQVDAESICAVSFIPTAENMAMYMVKSVGPENLKASGATLIGCRVYETSKCWAEYRIDRAAVATGAVLSR